MIPRSRRAVVAIGLALTAFVLGGCGKKGPIVAPERRVPAPPSELRASVEERTIVVSWSNPRTRADGSRLRDLALVRLFRRDEVPDAPPKPAMLSGDRVVGYQEIVRIALDAAPPAGVQLQDGGVSVRDSGGLSFGRRYVYVVTAEDSLGRSSPPSAAVAVTPVDTTPPSPPTRLIAIPAAGSVRLAWNASPEEDVALYAVYRAEGTGAFVRIATVQPITTLYTDRDVQSGRTYRYAVTALDRARKANESARSNEVSVTVP